MRTGHIRGGLKHAKFSKLISHLLAVSFPPLVLRPLRGHQCVQKACFMRNLPDLEGGKLAKRRVPSKRTRKQLKNNDFFNREIGFVYQCGVPNRPSIRREWVHPTKARTPDWRQLLETRLGPVAQHRVFGASPVPMLRDDARGFLLPSLLRVRR